METKNYGVDENGYYGSFGGVYVPDALKKCIDQLGHSYLEIINDPSFREEYDYYLREYVGRPSPLTYASRLSEKYGAKIYLKREDLNHTGAHKINNSLGQILLARRLGKKRIIAETGAGQHGVATATVCALLNMPCAIYMGEVDVERQALNVQKMRMLGAEIVSVTAGSKTLKEATDVALEYWCQHADDTYYVIGSTVGPHPYPDMVARFQSVISEEIKKQLQEHEGRAYPDYLIACIGGGSNAAGAFFHYIDDERVKLIEAEAGGKGANTPMTAATIHCGREGVLHGCRSLVMQSPEGEVLEPYSISAGLDYPGIGPLHAHLAQSGRTKVYSVNDEEALVAAFELTRQEGIIPALESSHALAVLGKLPLKKEDVVVLNLSGRGDKDMYTYMKAF